MLEFCGIIFSRLPDFIIFLVAFTSQMKPFEGQGLYMPVKGTNTSIMLEFVKLFSLDCLILLYFEYLSRPNETIGRPYLACRP